MSPPPSRCTAGAAASSITTISATPRPAASQVACTPDVQRLACSLGAVQTGGAGGGAVLQERAEPEDLGQQQATQRKARQRQRAQVADDGGVAQHVQRLGDQRPQGGHRKPQDLAVAGEGYGHAWSDSAAAAIDGYDVASMAEYQITYWRDIPSMVIARDSGEAASKVALPNRFQEAIDEAAMRAGASDADAYLADWRREDWQQRDGDPAARWPRPWPRSSTRRSQPERLNGLSEASG